MSSRSGISVSEATSSSSIACVEALECGQLKLLSKLSLLGPKLLSEPLLKLIFLSDSPNNLLDLKTLAKGSPIKIETF